jgi:hypothetical protein
MKKAGSQVLLDDGDLVTAEETVPFDPRQLVEPVVELEAEPPDRENGQRDERAAAHRRPVTFLMQPLLANESFPRDGAGRFTPARFEPARTEVRADDRIVSGEDLRNDDRRRPVRPPSRIAKRRPSSIAIGAIELDRRS